jgi:formate dehydrogenase alpha subunit
VAGLAAAFGSGAMTNPIADIEQSDVILITGSNTSENHPVLSSFVKRAVHLKGKTLIVVDPRRIPMTRFARKWLRPNLGTDVAWINGLMHVIIAENLHAKAYVESRTTGFEALRQTVERYTPDFVEGITGVPARELVETARLYARAERASILYCMGITQHTTGTDNVKSLANLAMLCGNVGIAGGGVNPLRGQNNVQGACDMGGLPDVFSGYQKVTDEAACRKMAEAWKVESLPALAGMKVTQMMPAAHEGRLKAMYIIGENPLVSDPDLNHAEKSLSHLDFLVVQDIFLTETAAKADVVLPSACYAEKDGTFANTERRVQRVRKAVEPPGDAREDWKIICEISGRMGYPMAYADSQEIMDELRRVTPSYAGISYARIEQEGLHWPCPNEEHPGTPILHREQFTIGKGVFHAIDWIPPAEKADGDYPLYLTTGRVLYQYHTGTMTMKTGGLNEIAPECFVEISPADAQASGVQEGNLVTIASRRGRIQARIRVSPKAVSGTVFLPFHYAQAAANRLTNAALDPVCGIPELKVCAVKIEALAAA